MSKKQITYSERSDAALVELFRQGNSEAFDELVQRYKGTIGFLASRYSAQGYDHNDFVQEGLLGLLAACKTYDGSSGFGTYLSVVTERRFISVIRRLNSKKSVPGNALVQLDGLEDKLLDTAMTPEQLLIQKEQQATLRTLLSDREIKVLTLYEAGHSYSEIGKKLGISEKSVDNALQRVRRKVKLL